MSSRGNVENSRGAASTSSGVIDSCESSETFDFLFSKNCTKFLPRRTCISPSIAWFADPQTPPEVHWEKLERYTLESIRKIRVCAKCRSFRCETVLPNITLARLASQEFIESATRFAERTPTTFLRTIVRMASSPIVSTCDCPRCAERKFHEQQGFRTNRGARRSVPLSSSPLPGRTIYVNELERESTKDRIRTWYAVNLGLLLEKMLLNGVFDGAEIQAAIDETFLRLISMGCALVALPLNFFITRTRVRNTMRTFFQEHIDRERRWYISTANERVLRTAYSIYAARFTNSRYRQSSPDCRCEFCKMIARNKMLQSRCFPLREEHSNTDRTLRAHQNVERLYVLSFRKMFKRFGRSSENPCANPTDMYSKLYFCCSKLYIRAICDDVYVRGSLTDAGFHREDETEPLTVTAKPCRARPGPRSYHERRRSRVERLRLRRIYRNVQQGV